MPNRLLCACLLVIASSGFGSLSAQKKSIDLPDPALAPRPRLIVLSGVAVQGSQRVFQTFCLSAERPLGPYQNVGLQYTSYLSQSNNIYDYSVLREGSYEVGMFSKFFLHGRLSGRRSHLYYGPQLRFGVRKMVYDNNYSNNDRPYNYRVTTAKALFCLGGQYTLGRALLEWSLPLGVEYAHSNLPTDIGYYGDENGRYITMLPGIALGFRL